MITKRGFLTGAASAAAIAATASRKSWAAASGSPRGATQEHGACSAAAVFDAVVFNERYSDARAFAQALADQGVPLLPIGGDAGTLWHGALGKQVAGGHRCLVGIGTSMDLLILQSLGREAGLRVRFLAHHDCRGRRTLTQSISANHASVVYRGLEGDLSAPDWPVRLAAMLPRAVGPIGGPIGAADFRLDTQVERSPDHPGMLVSWVLADTLERKNV